jgi:ABC-2 type transport system ATP-binding protein
MDGSKDLLVYEGVSKRYQTHFWQRPTLSLHDLTLSAREGEILGLLGPNGAGKTTAIKLALGLLFPDAGRVRLMGRPAEDRLARSAVGYLPETATFPDDLTGRELVELAGRLHGVPAADCRARSRDLLERVGLGAAAGRTLRKYSKGMVQRAGMARALIAAPRFVVLDEPMSGLDPIGRREFRDLILELRGQGTTVLFASHVLADAEMLCERVAILDGGRLAGVHEMGELAEERRILHWEAEVAGAAAVDGGERISHRGGRILLRFPARASFEEIVDAVRGAGGRPVRVVPQRETLEHLFLRTLGRDEDEAS